MSSPSGHLLINRTPRGSVIPSTLPALDNLTREQLIEWIHKLKRECTSLDEKGIFLAFSHAHPHTYTCTQRTADAIRRERDQLATSMDAEEEQISNRLMRKVSELREEKERLAQQVEREEEMLTNTLQKQMTALRQEKVDLENTLEAEEEQITNRMGRQISELTTRIRSLEFELERAYAEIATLRGDAPSDGGAASPLNPDKKARHD
jgi:chromosome segregation ATPase